VDLAEIEALNRLGGSEDQIIPESDGEDNLEDLESRQEVQAAEKRSASLGRLDLSRFLYG